MLRVFCWILLTFYFKRFGLLVERNVSLRFGGDLYVVGAGHGVLVNVNKGDKPINKWLFYTRLRYLNVGH